MYKRQNSAQLDGEQGMNITNDYLQIDWFHKPVGDPEHRDGATVEEVIAAALGRLKNYQNGLPCKENACAITHLEEALMWLNERMRVRIEKGVEGKDEAH